MYRIILVDDEPLILAGIASLIQWESLGCTLVGKATNGPNALELIRETQPDIVITDIRMPVMDGLELIGRCREEGMEFSFIVLTNLEEFHLARQAVRLGAVDYLVKLDLSPDSLISALKRAKEECGLRESHRNRELYDLLIKDNAKQLDTDYFKHLLLSQTAGPGHMPEGLIGRYTRPFIILFTMVPDTIQFAQGGGTYDFLFIRQQLMDILSGIISRYFKACTILETEKDTLVLIVSSKENTSDTKSVQDFCLKVNGALKTYFGLTAVFGLSPQAESIAGLPLALAQARTAREHSYYNSQTPVVFYKGQTNSGPAKRDFNINFLKRPLSSAISLNDSAQLREIFSQLLSLFAQYKPDKSQAVSACINLYTYLYSLFQAEGESYTHIFPCTMDIAQYLDHLGSLEDILTWLDNFCQKLCNLLPERRENRSDKLVYLTRQYVDAHYAEKLTLSDIAEHLKISSGHLSTTFSRFMDMTVSDYIAQVKIEHAKQLIDSHQYLIYEVADMLGFENAYYFSKVFKKVTGMSPREYEHCPKWEEGR